MTISTPLRAQWLLACASSTRHGSYLRTARSGDPKRASKVHKEVQALVGEACGSVQCSGAAFPPGTVFGDWQLAPLQQWQAVCGIWKRRWTGCGLDTLVLGISANLQTQARTGSTHAVAFVIVPQKQRVHTVVSGCWAPMGTTDCSPRKFGGGAGQLRLARFSYSGSPKLGMRRARSFGRRAKRRAGPGWPQGGCCGHRAA